MPTHSKKLSHEFLQKLCNKFLQHLCNATIKGTAMAVAMALAIKTSRAPLHQEMSNEQQSLPSPWPRNPADARPRKDFQRVM